MASTGWRFYVDSKPWTGAQSLYVAVTQPGHPRSQRFVVKPLDLEAIAEGAAYETPTLTESREDREDNIGDVTGFLQGALDAAWELGLRPQGFADHKNELTAVRYHLEDMRALAKVPPRG